MAMRFRAIVGESPTLCRLVWRMKRPGFAGWLT